MIDDIARRLRETAAPGSEGVPAAVAERVRVAADADGLVDVAWATVDTPVGRLTVAATPLGLVRIGFEGEEDVLESLAARLSPRVFELPSRLDAVRRQLDEYFAGRRRAFDVPIDPVLSRGFRRDVLIELGRVGYGETVSYGELARRVGHPGASRAVGTAMGTNPIPIVQPCHRALRTGGALGGYGGGLDVKRALLTLEGARLASWPSR